MAQTRTHRAERRPVLRAAAALLGVVLYAPAPAAAPQAQAPDLDPRIQKLVASISEERLERLMQTLVSFGTRNTFSDTTSPARGIGAARQWILDEMTRSSPRLEVSFESHVIPAGGRIPREVEVRNVVAVLPGRSPRRIYLSAHYDSLNLARPAAPAGQAPQARPPVNYDIDAPGADDDGSGTVLTMELARVFAESGLEFDATLVFLAVAGEEYGLLGAAGHAKAARAAKIPIQAVFNNDIVGNIEGGGISDSATVRLYSEGPEDSPSRALAQFTRRVAARYVPSHRVRLMARHDRFGRGGDHSAFNAEGFAGVCFRESRENYGKQHNTLDAIDAVSFPYIAQNARVNAAAVAVLALAPPPPAVSSRMLSRRPSGYDANLRWTASPGAVGYRVFWRDAWAPDWQHELYVGNVTEFILPHANIDDHVFGVAAVGPGGHESSIAAYVNPPRND